jgi:hypothetical protein
MRNTANVTGGKPIAVSSQSISGVSADNLESPFTTSMEERERCYSIILSWAPHETNILSFILCYDYDIRVSSAAQFALRSGARGVELQ